MKNILRFLFIYVAFISVANAITVPNRPSHEELPALKPTAFRYAAVKIDLTAYKMAGETESKFTSILNIDVLREILKFMPWNDRLNAMITGKKMMIGVLHALSVPMQSPRAGLSFRACLPGVLLPQALADCAIDSMLMPFNTEDSPQVIMAKMLAAGAGINLSSVLPKECQIEPVRRVIAWNIGYQVSFHATGAVVTDNCSVLGRKHFIELTRKIMEDQELPPKLAKCVRSIIDDITSPSADFVPMPYQKVLEERMRYLGKPFCAECIHGGCDDFEQSESLRTATFDEVQAAANTCTKPCFSSVRYLMATKLAEAGDDESMQRLLAMARGGYPEAMTVFIAKELGCDPFQLFDNGHQYIADQLFRDHSLEILERLFKEMPQLKFIYAEILGFAARQGNTKALRILFFKALQECTDSSDEIMPFLSNFCNPLIIGTINGQELNIMRFGVNQDTLLQLLMELRARYHHRV